jgi:hypothetical protein
LRRLTVERQTKVLVRDRGVYREVDLLAGREGKVRAQRVPPVAAVIQYPLLVGVIAAHVVGEPVAAATNADEEIP